MRSFVPSDPHHATSPQDWIERLRPQVVLLSLASGDRRARPASDVLQAVQDRTLLRTDQNGWIEIATDGERMWVVVERK